MISGSHVIPFEELPLSPQIARAIKELNYTEATGIQAMTIPFLLEGKDVIGHSSTGTGKTAAFGIPAVECVESELKQAQVLVLSPTRELAMQIAREMQKYAKYKEGISVAAVYGGASMSDQIYLLRKANIVIGTPGRLMDHLRRKTLKTDQLKMVILDEADEMLSMGFIDDIRTILSQTPAKRQTVLFSATMPAPILQISQDFLSDPQVVDLMAEQRRQTTIEQTYYSVPQQKKKDALSLLLRHDNAQRTIVFANTKAMVDEIAELLCAQGFKATGLHGDMSQPSRTQVMQGFRNGNINILVATDVAARGIDVDDVDAVINFDIPQSFEYYVHRIGRTGRAGKVGVSQTLVCNNRQVATLRELMRFTGSKIKEHQLPTSADMLAHAVDKSAAEVQELLQGKPGKAAQMLVQRLLKDDDSYWSAEQLAYALAEKIMGGDDKYTVPSELAANFEKPSGRNARIGKGRGSSGKNIVNVEVSIGRAAGVTPNHLLAAITETLDIPGSAVGKIDIKGDISLIGLSEEHAMALLNHRKPVKINKCNVSFSMSKDKKKHYSGAPTAPRADKRPSAYHGRPKQKSYAKDK